MKDKLQTLAVAAEKYLALDALLELAAEAPDVVCEPVGFPHLGGGVRIAVARDRAFCFYYEENLELLEKMGARIKFFSPIHDERLPDVSRLIIGGGYPELYAKELSGNESMLRSIREAADSGMPILAECGGFLYLQEKLTDKEGRTFDMAGVLKGSSHMTDKLSHFGYVSAYANADNVYLKETDRVRAMSSTTMTRRITGKL